MLSDIRKALANTVKIGMPTATVLPYPPKKIDLTASGAYAYIAPDPNGYVEAWQTFSTGGRGTLQYQVVIYCPDDNPGRRWDQLDDLIDPMSTSINVFSAIVANPTLGLDPTLIEASAAPLLTAVQAPRQVAEADGSVTFYELILPVQVIVKRS